MPVSRDELTGRWTRNDRRVGGLDRVPRPESDININAGEVVASDPVDSSPLAGEAGATHRGDAPMAGDHAGSSLGAVIPQGLLPAYLDAPAHREGSRSVSTTGLALKDEPRSPSPFVIGGFGGASSDDTGSWSRVPRRRRSASPVLSKRSVISNNNSFASLTSLHDTSLVDQEDGDEVVGSPVVLEEPRTPKKPNSKRLASENRTMSDAEFDALLETPTPVDKGKTADRRGASNVQSKDTPPSGNPGKDATTELRYAGIGEEELDVGAQRAALASLQSAGAVGTAADRDTSVTSSQEPWEDLFARTRKSAEVFKNGCEREVREARRERDTVRLALLEAERARLEAERARVDAEKRLTEMMDKLDRLVTTVDAQAAEVAALKRDRGPGVGHRGEAIQRRDHPPHRVGSPEPGSRAAGDQTGIHSLSTARPGVMAGSASATSKRGGRTLVAPPSRFISSASSLGQTLKRKLRQLEDAMLTLEQSGSSVIKPNIKPEPPKTYDGRSDLDAFQRYVEQSVEYLIDGMIMRERHVSKIGHFLEKDALQFFNRVVKNPEEWAAERFFDELFNYCFPDGFMNAIRARWNTWMQKGSSVKVYAATMEGFRDDLGGEISDRQFVHRFWQGLNDEISQELYRDRLHPDIDTYEDVLESALIAERVINNSLHRGGAAFGSPRSGLEKTGNGRGRRGGGNGGQFGRNDNNGNQSGVSAAKSNTQVKETGPGAQRNSDRSRRRDRNPKSDSPLSEAQMKEHLENNLCFKCHKAGHMSRNCPEGQQVTSSTRDKAPGSKTSYAVRYADNSEPADDDIQVTDGDEPEVLDELLCGSVRFRLEEGDREEGAGADTAFVQDDGLDPFGNPPPYEEPRTEVYDAHA
ncbi:hypothetical protein PUNSTDRAFT_130453, partial [Punctularia strigosozonata HHB-11173 SS5]|uniref:uncharacterized protein n=1 Tax=Punctularia strigosozonata (strain HHB-11173) TaxID=741275 RepID=UPI00044165A2